MAGAVAVGLALTCSVALAPRVNASTGTLAPQAEASANTACPAQLICAFEDFDFSGGFVSLQQGAVPNFGGQNTVRYNNGQSVYNSISSVINNSVYTYCLYTGENFTGFTEKFPPNTQLSSLGSGVNDSFKSGRTFC
jgi:Peptidase inhibitor family I36